MCLYAWCAPRFLRTPVWGRVDCRVYRERRLVSHGVLGWLQVSQGPAYVWTRGNLRRSALPRGRPRPVDALAVAPTGAYRGLQGGRARRDQPAQEPRVAHCPGATPGRRRGGFLVPSAIRARILACLIPVECRGPGGEGGGGLSLLPAQRARRIDRGWGVLQVHRGFPTVPDGHGLLPLSL